MVLIPVALSGALLWAFATELSWIFFTYFWLMFPAFGLLVRGVAGLYDSPDEPTASNSKGRELLGALREHGELTSAQVAMETSLSVAEADGMLRSWPRVGTWTCACAGLFYALWELGVEDTSGSSRDEVRGYARDRAWYHFHPEDR